MMEYRVFNSPIGLIRIAAKDGFIVEIIQCEESAVTEELRYTELLSRAESQLKEYFNHERTCFDLPVRFISTSFRMRVWEKLKESPYGETKTYGQIAKEIGNPKAARAVGGACHDNPALIVVPCHRVIGSSGALTGFAGGIDSKKTLLDLEKNIDPSL